jgi:hypothetical protein
MFKIFGVLLYTIILRFLADTLLAFNIVNPQYIIFYVLMIVMFLPEMGFAFAKSFRNWLKDGIEDSDGKFNSSDFKSLMSHYSTLWCIRLFVVFGLLEAFYSIQVREVFVVGSLLGAFGIEAISFFSRFKK